MRTSIKAVYAHAGYPIYGDLVRGVCAALVLEATGIMGTRKYNPWLSDIIVGMLLKFAEVNLCQPEWKLTT